ncbi:MAG: hypothetical protein AAGF12_41910 [Myxococcota bacterium]
MKDRRGECFLWCSAAGLVLALSSPLHAQESATGLSVPVVKRSSTSESRDDSEDALNETQGPEAPPGYRFERAGATGPIAGGAILGAVAYLTSIILGLHMASEEPNAGAAPWMYVPVFGPFIAAAATNCNASGVVRGMCNIRTAGALVVGGLQTAGMILMIVGAIPSWDLVPVDEPEDPRLQGGAFILGDAGGIQLRYSF